MIISRQPILCYSPLDRKKDETMLRDPVCGVILNEKTAKFKINHEGKKYYFCSVDCKKKFKRNRSKFVR